MEEKQPNRPQTNFFDQLMFGSSVSQTKETKEETQENLRSTNSSNNEASADQEPKLSEQESIQDNPQLDLQQMLGQIDTVVGYVDKLRPTINKLSPIIEMLKSFSSPNKK